MNQEFRIEQYLSAGVEHINNFYALLSHYFVPQFVGR